MRNWAAIIAFLSLSTPASADVVQLRPTAIQSATLSCDGEGKNGERHTIKLSFGNLRSVRSASQDTEYYTINYDVALDAAPGLDLPSRLTARSNSRSPAHGFPFEHLLSAKGWTGYLSFARGDVWSPPPYGETSGQVRGAMMIWPLQEQDGFIGRCEGLISLEKSDLAP